MKVARQPHARASVRVFAVHDLLRASSFVTDMPIEKIVAEAVEQWAKLHPKHVAIKAALKIMEEDKS